MTRSGASLRSSKTQPQLHPAGDAQRLQRRSVPDWTRRRALRSDVCLFTGWFSKCRRDALEGRRFIQSPNCHRILQEFEIRSGRGSPPGQPCAYRAGSACSPMGKLCIGGARTPLLSRRAEVGKEPHTNGGQPAGADPIIGPSDLTSFETTSRGGIACVGTPCRRGLSKNGVRGDGTRATNPHFRQEDLN